MLHFQQLVNSLKVFATAKCKVQCFLKFLTKRDIMQFAALLHDVVSALSVMSQVFQRKDATYVVKHYEGSFLRAGVAVNSVEFEWTLLKNNLYSEPEEVKNLA